jgi:chromosome segregation protein
MLRRLVLHGFKTFASRTTFEFDDGITAVIGPNGSGKSNLADAVRWVLGETSQSALRAKRVEDVIFAGSHARPAMGMAEVSLTLDNSARLLDTDFAEVTITRRAYRDGETHYLINGARVRLKDVIELTAPLGGAYTVVGQGLVDAALSLRPEERRGLFEHAAGIAAQQLKRAEAERRLAAAEANCQRLTDILAELTPRLRQLERQARQAGEAGQVQAQLTDALRRWYGGRWGALAAAVAAAEAAAAAARRRLEAERAALTALVTERAALRERIAAARAAADRRRAERAGLSRELAEAVRQAAVAAERAAALRRRAQDDAGDETAAARRRQELDAALADVTAALAALDDEERQARAAAAAAASAASAAACAWREAETTAAGHRQALLAGATRLGSLETALARLHERGGALDREAARATATAAERAAARATLHDQRAALTAEAEAVAARARDLQAQQAALGEQLTTLAAALSDDRARLAALDHDLTAARARLEALGRLRDSGAGLAGGPKAVLAAARAGRLSGILGPVAALIHAPARLDAALEVALGSHLQDIAVERWADAEAAIAFLKQSGAGRATFQPLDTLRPPRPLDPERGPGIAGIAAELVEYEPRFAPLVQSLLGRVLIVEDLATSRRLIGRGRWTLVTLAGEITRPGGAVTGGAAVREAGVLARERELRDLPLRIAGLERQRAAAAAGVAARQAEHAALIRRRDELAAAQADLAREADQRAHALSRLASDLVALDRAEAEAARQQAEADGRRAQLQAEIDRQAAALAAARAAQAATQAALDDLTARLPELAERRDETARTAADARAALARLDERRRAARARQADLAARRERLAADEQAAARRREALRRDLAAAEAEHAAQADAHHRLARALAAAEAADAPLEAALAADLAAAEQLDGRLAAAQAALVARESEAGRAAVAAEHARGELAALAARVEADLPGIDPATLAPPAADDPRLEATIATLRERLRRIGLVDPAVIEEHAAARDRHAFLTRELADVEAAVRALRGAIAELDALMRQRFADTFQAVNAAFGRAFSRLFNGGSARLVLTDDGDAPGVDILAQPPGKRQQSLALLSGGERALTAAALLFAILEVNPSPFCLLDEVDAALDESNVVRFRDLLADLAMRTQFVVITHNRGTIEGADALYGISMGQDGVSQVISLRLDPATAPEGAALAPRAADD